MSGQDQSASSRDRVQRRRDRQRAQGLRPVQFWLPDVHGAAFRAEAHRQSAAVGTSPSEAADQGFIDAASGPDDA